MNLAETLESLCCHDLSAQIAHLERNLDCSRWTLTKAKAHLEKRRNRCRKQRAILKLSRQVELLENRIQAGTGLCALANAQERNISPTELRQALNTVDLADLERLEALSG